MKYLLTITLSSLISITSFSATLLGNEGSININYPNNRYPLASKPYIELPIGDVKPAGWLKIQMERMCTGMTGHLDSIYTKVMGPRNGWLGGDGDVWERGPYWIDGLLPLAYCPVPDMITSGVITSFHVPRAVRIATVACIGFIIGNTTLQ